MMPSISVQVVDYIVRRHNENFAPANATSAAAGPGRHHRLQQGNDQHAAISQEPAAAGAGQWRHFDAGAAARLSAGLGVHRHRTAQPWHFIAILLAGDRPDLGPAALQRRAAGGHCCAALRSSNPLPQAANFIEILNGETALDSDGFQRGAGSGGSARFARQQPGAAQRHALCDAVRRSTRMTSSAATARRRAIARGRAFARNLAAAGDQHSDRHSRGASPRRAREHGARAGRHLQSLVCSSPSSLSRDADMQLARVPIIPLPQPGCRDARARHLRQHAGAPVRDVSNPLRHPQAGGGNLCAAVVADGASERSPRRDLFPHDDRRTVDRGERLPVLSGNVDDPDRAM